MVDVSGMLMEFYKTNSAKAPKTQQQQLQLKYRQTSPTSAETNEPSTIAAIAINGAAEELKASKNLQRGEMPMPTKQLVDPKSSEAKTMAFHPRIKFMNKTQPVIVAAKSQTETSSSARAIKTNARDEIVQHFEIEPAIMTSIPTSVLVPTSPQIDIKPVIHPTTGLVIEPNTSGAMATSVIKQVPSATAIAAALLQQQLRAANLSSSNTKNVDDESTKILEKLLRHQRSSGCVEGDELQSKVKYVNDESVGGGAAADDEQDDMDEEYDERYNDFDDIHLTEDGKNGNYSHTSSMPNIFQSAGDNEYTESQKLLLARVQVQALLNDYGAGNEHLAMAGHGNMGGSGGGDQRVESPHDGSDGSGEPIYECRHCGKKYRWKSTLRRHENVECGGKEPSHQCPYCPYKSKQRGNLGVHVRKHHSDLPQLESRRRSKYSQNTENNGSERGSFSANASDDSSSKLVIDLKNFKND